MNWITQDIFEDLRQNLRWINDDIQKSVDAGLADGWPSENIAFLRSILAMNEKACATDQARFVCTALAMNKLVWLLIHRGEESIDDATELLEALCEVEPHAAGGER